MRTLLNAAFLASSLIGGLGFVGPVAAADLDHYYEPRPVLPPPPPPPCGVYSPCYRPRPHFGYVGPRYRYGFVVPPYHRVYDPYGYDHDGFGRLRQNVDRYGYDRSPDSYEHVGFGRLDRYGDEERRRENERFERPRAPVYAPDPYDPG